MIEPLFSKVVIKIDETETQTKSGILIASEAQTASLKATVMAIGPDVTAVKVDDRVMLDKFHAKIDIGDGLSIVEESDIIGKFSK